MKKLLTIVFVFTSTILFSQCPPEGNGRNDKEKSANILKNRNITVKKTVDEVTLQQILTSGTDFTRFSSDKYIMVEGYVTDFKEGGKESCNCNTDVDSLKDNHIYIGLSPNSTKDECMIVEITPKFKRLNPKFNLKTIKNKKVQVYGLMFFDEEHKGSAKNTCKTCEHVWRKTCWEIHPVTKIIVE